ncbi:MAG: RidA family protein [Candidatus Dadabacteria bacterium]|nr:MAG: RidA family protein [Candidatus Dadabacteria bacterium]
MAKTVRYNYASGSPWEPLRGYSRAVRVGNQLFISGTTAVDDNGEVVAPGDPYEQTRYVIRVLRTILKKTGFDLSDIVRTRLFITDMSQWNQYARAHREFFEHIRPASSIVQVARLVDPRLVIEMEAVAVLGAGQTEDLEVHWDGPD